MEHLAIMKKTWKLMDKIISGDKTIESRWYSSKYPPWNKIKIGDTVYFKNSGELVSLKASVSNVEQFSGLTPEKVRNILDMYGNDDGLGIDDIPKFFDLFKNKKYCILVFLKNPKTLKPFPIDKKGYGSMSSWKCVNKIGDIKKR